MQATRILPDLQCSLLCEEVRQEVNGNLFSSASSTSSACRSFRIVAGRICVFNRWAAGIGQFGETVRLVAPDQTTVISRSEMKFELRDPALSATNVTFFGQVKFEAAGTYYIEVLVDDVMKLRYPVPVIHAPMPNQPQPAPENRADFNRPFNPWFGFGGAGVPPEWSSRTLCFICAHLWLE